MTVVQFPSLGITLEVNPVAFTIGDFSVQWYGVIIAAGFLLAFLYAMVSCRKFNVNKDKLIDAVIGGLIGGIVGARLYYVLFYPGDKYINDPLSAFYIWEGGLGIYGGIIGGVLCGALIAKIRKLKVPVVLDLAALGFLIGQGIGRWGNFVNQEAFGSATDLPWGMISEKTQAVVSGPVHPCFLYESLWCLLGFVLLHIFSRKFRRYDGQTFLLYMIWYGIGRFFIEGLRTDSLITPFFDIRVSQLVAAATVLAGIILLIVFRKKTSLTGCGSQKIMELNGIVIPEKKSKTVDAPVIEDDGVSTIFGDHIPEEITGDLDDALEETGEDVPSQNSDSDNSEHNQETVVIDQEDKDGKVD